MADGHQPLTHSSTACVWGVLAARCAEPLTYSLYISRHVISQLVELTEPSDMTFDPPAGTTTLTAQALARARCGTPALLQVQPAQPGAVARRSSQRPSHAHALAAVQTELAQPRHACGEGANADMRHQHAAAEPQGDEVEVA